AWHVLESFLIPAVLGRPWRSPADVAARLAPVRRHFMAKAGLEGAVWDLYARLQGLPLSRALGGTRDRIPSGIAVGITGDLAALGERVKQALDAGYARVKIKIKPGWDVEPVRYLRDRKSTRLNSSHVKSSYAVFCLKKKTSTQNRFLLTQG